MIDLLPALQRAGLMQGTARLCGELYQLRLVDTGTMFGSLSNPVESQLPDSTALPQLSSSLLVPLNVCKCPGYAFVLGMGSGPE